MKTKVILVFSVAAALAVGFAAGHFQASRSWKHRLYGDFYTQCGGEAFVLSGALKDIRGGDRDAGLALLENHLDLDLARLGPEPVEQRDAVVTGGIRKARDYRLEYPWHGSAPPQFQEAEAKVLASVK